VSIYGNPLDSRHQKVDSFATTIRYPSGVCVNDNHEVFIADYCNHCIRVFSYAGHLLRTLGAYGLIHFPIAVFINNFRHLVVLDATGSWLNMTILNEQGAVLSSYRSDCHVYGKINAAMNSKGLLAVSYRIHSDSQYHVGFVHFVSDPWLYNITRQSTWCVYERSKVKLSRGITVFSILLLIVKLSN